jgi:hypothetical protein
VSAARRATSQALKRGAVPPERRARSTCWWRWCRSPASG